MIHRFPWSFLLYKLHSDKNVKMWKAGAWGANGQFQVKLCHAGAASLHHSYMDSILWSAGSLFAADAGQWKQSAATSLANSSTPLNSYAYPSTAQIALICIYSFYQTTYNDYYKPCIQRWPLTTNITADFVLVRMDSGGSTALGEITINPTNHRMHISLRNAGVNLSGAVFFFDPI